MFFLLKVLSNLNTLDDIVNELRKAIVNKELIIIIGNCSVDYVGRSESRLTEGDRLVIIKQNGALIIHRPEGYSPVNWQPETSIIEVKSTGDKLVLTAIRDKPREIVNVYFSKIHTVIHGKLVDYGEFVKYLDELTMRDLLFENSDLIEKGLKIIEKEKQVDQGSIDLFGYDQRGKPVIIELKRVTATREAVYQLYSYVQSYVEKTSVKPRGILVAPSFTASAIEALSKLGLEWREIDLKKLWSLKREKEIKHESILKYMDQRE